MVLLYIRCRAYNAHPIAIAQDRTPYGSLLVGYARDDDGGILVARSSACWLQPALHDRGLYRYLCSHRKTTQWEVCDILGWPLCGGVAAAAVVYLVVVTVSLPTRSTVINVHPPASSSSSCPVTACQKLAVGGTGNCHLAALAFCGKRFALYFFVLPSAC